MLAAEVQPSTDPVTRDDKVSPTLTALLSEAEPNDRQDAIVVYRAEPLASPDGRGSADPRLRMQAVAAQADAQRETRARLLAGYRQDSASRQPRPAAPLAARDLGGGALPVAAVEVTRKTLRALADQPDVVAIMPNQRLRLIQPRAVDYAGLAAHERKDGLTWGLKQLEIREVWQTTRGGGIRVAVMDTGVHGDHPALAGRVGAFTVIDPLGRRIAAQPSFDAGEHGTHVCGVIAGGETADGVAIGVAPEATLLAAAVLVGESTLAALVQGLSWAVEQGADVVNLSLGFAYYEPAFTTICELLRQSGTLPVVAIGNDSHGSCSSPGSAHNALAVGAVERLTGGRLAVAPFSSGASLSFPDAEPALVVKPDLAAPGAQVYSAIPPRKTDAGAFEYSFMDGTSMAAPHVAGVIALLLAAVPDAPLAAVETALKETAWHPDGARRRPDNRWGYGLIRPVEALRALRS